MSISDTDLRKSLEKLRSDVSSELHAADSCDDAIKKYGMRMKAVGKLYAVEELEALIYNSVRSNS